MNSFEMIEERNRISRTFGEYVSPVVVDTLIVPRTIPIGDVQVKGREGTVQIYQVA